MKKMSLLLVTFATLSFSTSHSIDKKNATIFGACLVVGATGSYYYHNYYKPAQTIANNSTNNKETIIQLHKELLTPDTNTATAELFIEPTINNNTTGIAPEHSFLNIVANSVKTMNLEKLLEENMEILEG